MLWEDSSRGRLHSGVGMGRLAESVGDVGKRETIWDGHYAL